MRKKNEKYFANAITKRKCKYSMCPTLNMQCYVDWQKIKIKMIDAILAKKNTHTKIEKQNSGNKQSIACLKSISVNDSIEGEEVKKKRWYFFLLFLYLFLVFVCVLQTCRLNVHIVVTFVVYDF